MLFLIDMELGKTPTLPNESFLSQTFLHPGCPFVICSVLIGVRNSEEFLLLCPPQKTQLNNTH